MEIPCRKRNADEKLTGQADNKVKDQSKYDPTSIFDPDKTKKLLHREEPKMAKIPKQHVRLIDTTSAIFLRNLIAASASTRESPEECVTLNQIRTAISSNPSLQFLEGAANDIQEKDATHAKEHIPGKKGKRPATSKPSDEKLKKARSVIPKSHADNETVGAAVAAAASGSTESLLPVGQIVPDEDDYD
jgi:hypothetical protein